MDNQILEAIKKKYPYPNDSKFPELWTDVLQHTMHLSVGWKKTPQWKAFIDYCKANEKDALYFCMHNLAEEYWCPFMLDAWWELFNENNRFIKIEGYMPPQDIREAILLLDF